MNMNRHSLSTLAAALLAVLSSVEVPAQYTSGIGRYPGNPSENNAPKMEVSKEVRNIALNRAAYHSSCYDFNQTAQLTTDGIISESPIYLEVSTRDSLSGETLLSNRDKEKTLDLNWVTQANLYGQDVSLSYNWHGMAIKASKVVILGSVDYNVSSTGKHEFKLISDGKAICKVSGGGITGDEAVKLEPTDPNKMVGKRLRLPSRKLEVSFDLGKRGKSLADIEIGMAWDGAVRWSIEEIAFYGSDGERITKVLPSSQFSSAWMSEGGGEQWVYVDLGVQAEVNKVVLAWIEEPESGMIQVSDDAKEWRTVASLSKKSSEFSFKSTDARYVRVLMTKPGASGRYVLSEMEVYGKGGLVAVPKAEAQCLNGKLDLGGGDWWLQRASEIHSSGEEISTDSYGSDWWIPATVPATVLTSYVNIGALPDPNYAYNKFEISESFFNSDFWYRRVFSVPEEMKGKRIFLNFDGINWKADIYLNGKKIDRIEGAFHRGRTDITGLVQKGDNVLAVRIISNANPGLVKQKNSVSTDLNGGALGADNPTFHATIGWDWISTIRGRDIGLWNDVYLTSSGSVSLSDPLVSTTLNLPDTLATVTPLVVVTNDSDSDASGILKGRIGDITFEKPITVKANSKEEISFDPQAFTQLKDRSLRLWWPNGYGEPYLYDAGFEFIDAAGNVSDTITYKAGIRMMEYSEMNTRLQIFINGRRFIPLGGNWGFSENNLNYRAREYDIAVKYHRDMNFNMMRNWVGQIGDEELYDACDKYGIMVWQDFWLANPWDGPDPDADEMFVAPAADFTSRMRRHPSIGIYCGRNEGYPPESLNGPLK